MSEPGSAIPEDNSLSVSCAGQSRGPAYRLGEDFECLKNAKIMMVDDEAITLKVMRTLLQHAGYRQFYLIDDPSVVIEQVRAHRPDILLLDVVMPGMSGFDLLKRVRADEAFAHLPIIILTSSVDANTKLQALDLGATDFLSKPVDASELSLRVRNTLAAKAYQDQLSYYDLLTHLPNQSMFQQRLDWAMAKVTSDGSDLALLQVNFSDLERVGESFGPSTGDQVLVDIAKRMALTLRPDSTTISDEIKPADLFQLSRSAFLVLIQTSDGYTDSTQIAQRILDAMKAPFVANRTDVYLTPNIGIAVYPDDATTAAELYRRAAGACSQASTLGLGKMQFYSADLNRHTVDRLNLEAEIRNALDTQSFSLVYQPKVDAASCKIIGAEALLRWKNSDGQEIPPDVFIPVAEELSLILPIGAWVLNTACEQAARWHKEGIRVKLSVNISAEQLFAPDFITSVLTVLKQTQLDPKMLTLEITESFLIKGVTKARKIIAVLRKVGVEFSIDDFGTGYSSLSYLKNFKADEVKLDRAFITDVVKSKQDQALVYAVTYLAKELGMRVCAEGVETQSQFEYLRGIHCDQIQGFYFSRPIEPVMFRTLFLENQKVADSESKAA